MKKILKRIILIIIVAAIIFILYVLLNKPIKFKQHARLKELYDLNYVGINCSILNVIGEEIGTINPDKLNEILTLLKEEKIIPVKSYEYDKIEMGKSYSLLLKTTKNQIRIIISNNTITIGKKVYWISGTNISLVNDIIEQYSEYYFNMQ